MNPVQYAPYYEYTTRIRVDANGRGDVNNLTDALVMASSYFRDVFNRVLITVNEGIYQGGPYDVPEWVIIEGVEGGKNTNNGHGTVFWRSSTTGQPANETYFFRMAQGSSLSNMQILLSPPWPANFDSEYAGIRAVGGVEIRDCYLIVGGAVGSTAYTGATRAYLILKEPTQGGTVGVYGSWLQSSGSGFTTVRYNRSSGAVGMYYSQLHGRPNYHLELNHTNPNSISTLLGVRTYTDDGTFFPERPLTATLKATSSATRIRLFNTRIELNQREGSPTVTENHPTPQQLETSVRAKTISTAVNYTVDGYEDGTVLRTGGDITMPLLSETIDGQSFVLINDGVSSMLVNGNGVNIDGGASITVESGDRIIAQRVGLVWYTISSEITSSTAILTKSGTVVSGSFTGETATVSFGTNMPSTSYSIQLTAKTALTDTQVLCTYESKAVSGFTIRISSSANTPDVDWVATAHSNP